MFKTKKQKIKLIVTILIVALISVLSCYLANVLGLDDINKLKSIVNNGVGGAIVYILILSLQIVFLPINSLVLIVPAIILFGSGKAFLLSFIGLIIGSILAFSLGRLFGEQFVGWLFGKENVKVWQDKLKNCKLLLPIFMLIPIFPDELLCVGAGVSKYSYSYFILVVLFTRAIDLYFTCYVGASIPFRDWYLLIWLLIAIVAVALTIILTKNQKQIEDYLSSKIKSAKLFKKVDKKAVKNSLK